MSITYVSLDIETDGPCPGLNSMLSLGAAAFTENDHKDGRHAGPAQVGFLVSPNHDGAVIGLRQWNLGTLPDAHQNPHTMTDFWAKQSPETWEEARKNWVHPAVAIGDFCDWVNGLPGDHKVAVAWPASWDWSFIYYYIIRFNCQSPFGHSCLDIKSLAYALTGRWRSRSALVRSWLKNIENPRPHVARYDALEQGQAFFVLKRHLEELRGFPVALQELINERL